MWVARDRDLTLRLFINKPVRSKYYWYDINNKERHSLTIKDSYFTLLKWEDEPVEVVILPKKDWDKLIINTFKNNQND